MKTPDLKLHLLISLTKSFIRIIACCISMFCNTLVPLAIGFMLAEFLGVLEELL